VKEVIFMAKKTSPWLNMARPNQLPPQGEWNTWLVLAGRGFGKTRTGAETLRMWLEQGVYKRAALIGKSIIEARSIMVEGHSGILSLPKSYVRRPRYEASLNRVVWPNGSQAELFGGDTFERLRGPQFDVVWIDEFAKFKHPEALWTQVQFALRLGKKPCTVITTTPRPVPLIEKLLSTPGVEITRGSTYDNSANLATSFLQQIQQQYDHTAIGAQEIYGEILTERDGALWQRRMISHQAPKNSHWKRIVIGIDPATTHHDQSDETGIIVVGLADDNQAFVLDDLSGRFSPQDWAQRVIRAYREHKVDRIVVEVNKGGDLVERVLKTYDSTLALRSVRATRDKTTRAEPIAALYEQGRVKHLKPFLTLEKQLCEYIPGITRKSPDRMDALVWALTDLYLEKEASYTPKVWAF
jgi:predicted phage terminase large subunit-like protein